MRRILLNGGTGFSRSNLAEACVAHGDHVRVLDNLTTGSIRNLADFGGIVFPFSGNQWGIFGFDRKLWSNMQLMEVQYLNSE